MDAKADGRANCNVCAHDFVEHHEQPKRRERENQRHCHADPAALDENVWRQLVETLVLEPQWIL